MDTTPQRPPEVEVAFRFSRASGPGGQKVNKTASRAEARWDVEASPTFSPEEKARLRRRLATRMTKEGQLLVACEEHRSQRRNRERALEILRELVARALAPRKPRRPTRPPKKAEEKRLEEKKRRAEVKAQRRKPIP